MWSFSSGSVQQCYNEATIIGDYKVGGVVGYNYGTVKNCYNTSNVIGSYTSIGGVVGQVDQGTVQYCYNTGFVSGSNYFGAIIGLYSEPDIEDDGPIIVVSSQENHEKNTRANSCAVSNCFYLSEPTYGGNKYGTAMSQQQFASGEVAYLLQGDQTEHIWGQNIGTDTAPVLFGIKVYLANGSYLNVLAGDEPELNNGYYEIFVVEQLYWFADQVNGGNTSINGKLMMDIVVNEDVLSNGGSLNGDGSKFRRWVSIGDSTKEYSGTFDGNGHTVSGLYFDVDTWSNVGFFGYVSSEGIVKNVGVADSYMRAGHSVAGVVARNSGTVINCYNTGNVSGECYIGGVVGNIPDVGGSVSYCYNIGNVSGWGYLGGVVGGDAFDDGLDDDDLVDYPMFTAAKKGILLMNCYYLAGCVQWGNSCGTAMTAEEFDSGEVAYLLGAAFGQTLGTDIYPVLSGMKVFKNQIGGCVESTYEYVYSNIQASAVVSHNWVDATCTARQTCFDCGLMVGQMRPHEFGQTIVHKPAPGVVGYSEHTCTVCGYREEFDFVELTGMTVSGLIKSFILDSEVTVELLCDGEVKYRTVIFGSNVYYTIENVQPGAYTLRISKDKHVTREYEFVVGQEDVTLNAKICHLGDVTGDGSCNVKDYQRLLRHVNKTDPLN